LKGMKPGAVLRVLATDPAAVIDIPHFCHESGHVLIESGDIEAAQYYLVRRT